MRKVLFCLFLFLSACGVDHGTLTIVSNKQIDLNNLDIENSQKIENIKGEDQYELIMSSIQQGNMKTNINGALSNALTKTKGDLMTNVKVKQNWFFIPPFYTTYGWTVEGDVVKLK